MRIISGISKGKKIYEPKNNLTRPLKDLTKESIFNIIVHSNKFNIQLENSSVLDLFSGTGSFGLECLSRGSSNLTFVENYKDILPVLKKNIHNLKYQNNSQILEQDIINKLDFKIFKKKFDIIFLDPPFKAKELFKILKKIIYTKLLKTGGIIIIHRHKKEDDRYPDEFLKIEEKFYGISKIIFGTYS
jgi:16S rRNA (guanine966-N2)-methyltransferase